MSVNLLVIICGFQPYYHISLFSSILNMALTRKFTKVTSFTLFFHFFVFVIYLLGDGSALDPVRIYITSLALLKNTDTTNQNHVAIFHLDGTYRITINNMPLSIFGRTDMNRKFFPIALALVSRETAEELEVYLMAIQQVCRDFNINMVITF